MSNPANPIQTTVRIPEQAAQLVQEFIFQTNKRQSIVLRAMLVVAGRHEEEVLALLQEQL